MALIAAYAFDEGTGTTSTDASGNSRIATVNGWTTGHTSYGAVGDASHAAASYSGALITSPTAVSFMFWFYPTRTSSGGLDGNLTFLSIDSAGTPGYLVVAWSNSTHLLVQFTNAAGTDYSAVASVTTAQNTWVHVAATWVSGTLLLYLNGVQVGTAATSGVLPSLSWLETGGLAAAGAYNLGVIDDLRVYDEVRTSTQIVTDMNTPVVPSGAVTPSILAYGTPASTASGNTVTLDDPTGTTAGALVLACVTMGAANAGSFVSTDLTATGWLNCGFYTYLDVPDGNNIGVWWMYKYAAGGPVTGQNFASGSAGGIISFATGITLLVKDNLTTSGDPTSDTLQANNTSPSGTSLAIPSFTPGANNSFLIALTALQWQGATGSQPGGWTRLSGGWFNPSNGPQFAIDTKAQTTAAATGTLTWTFSPSVDAPATTILTIRGASGGSTSASAAAPLALSLAAHGQARASASIVLNLTSAATATGVVPTTASAHIDLSTALAAAPRANASATLPTTLAVAANANGVAISSASILLSLSEAATAQGRASASTTLSMSETAAAKGNASAAATMNLASAGNATGTAVASAGIVLNISMKAAQTVAQGSLFAFYAQFSGLGAGDLTDHEAAYWRLHSALAPNQGTTNDHIISALNTLYSSSEPDINVLLYKFYDTDGLGGSFQDAMDRFVDANVDPFAV